MQPQDLLDMADEKLLQQVSGFTAMGVDRGFQAQKAIDIKNTKRIAKAFDDHGSYLNKLALKLDLLNDIVDKYSKTTTKLSVAMVTISIAIAVAAIIQAAVLFR